MVSYDCAFNFVIFELRFQACREICIWSMWNWKLTPKHIHVCTLSKHMCEYWALIEYIKECSKLYEHMHDRPQDFSRDPRTRKCFAITKNWKYILKQFSGCICHVAHVEQGGTSVTATARDLQQQFISDSSVPGIRLTGQLWQWHTMDRSRQRATVQLHYREKQHQRCICDMVKKVIKDATTTTKSYQ